MVIENVLMDCNNAGENLPAMGTLVVLDILNPMLLFGVSPKISRLCEPEIMRFSNDFQDLTLAVPIAALGTLERFLSGMHDNVME